MKLDCTLINTKPNTCTEPGVQGTENCRRHFRTCTDPRYFQNHQMQNTHWTTSNVYLLNVDDDSSKTYLPFTKKSMSTLKHK